jgi:hypothetical protein
LKAWRRSGHAGEVGVGRSGAHGRVPQSGGALPRRSSMVRAKRNETENRTGEVSGGSAGATKTGTRRGCRSESLQACVSRWAVSTSTCIRPESAAEPFLVPSSGWGQTDTVRVANLSIHLSRRRVITTARLATRVSQRCGSATRGSCWSDVKCLRINRTQTIPRRRADSSIPAIHVR